MRSSAADLERRFEARLRAEGPSLGSPELLERAVDLIRGRGVRSVLDLGTGCGELPARLKAEGLNAVGLDLCGTLLDRARLRSPRPSLIQGDVERLPVASGRMDLVSLLLVAHYLGDPGAALAEAARVLRPGGWLLLADRTASPEPSLREKQHQIEILRNPSLQRLLTHDELAETLRGAGFRLRVVDGIQETLPLVTWLSGVAPGTAARIRSFLGSLDVLAADRIRVRIDLFLAQKA